MPLRSTLSFRLCRDARAYLRAGLRLGWLRNPAQFGAVVAELNTHLQGHLHIMLIVTDPQGRCCPPTRRMRRG